MRFSVIIRKLSELFLTLIIFALLSITYFYWQPYDKCLFQPALIIDKIVIFDFITRIIYYLLYFSSIILVAVKLFKSEIDNHFKQNKVNLFKLYLSVFAIRLLFDIITYVIKRITSSGEVTIIGVFLILESLFDIIIVTVILRWLCAKECAERTTARKVFIVVSVVLVTVLLSVLIMQYSACMELYNESISAWKYEIEYCNLYRDIIINFSAVLLAYGLLKHKKHIDNKKPFRDFCTALIRVFCIICIFALMNMIKVFILPYSTIKSVSSAGNLTTNIERAEGYADAFEIDDWY